MSPTDEHEEPESGAPQGEAAPEYEFDETANVTFLGLAGSMRIVAVLQIVAGAILVGALGIELRAHRLGPAAMFGVQALLNAVVSYWLFGAARNFQGVAETSGSDVSLLMRALAELGKTYRLHRALILICFGLFVAAGVSTAMSGERTPENQGGQY